MTYPILSIIIPVYNLEDYIGACLDSVYSQFVDEEMFEVVAIDDGSSDNSLERLHDYASVHANMQVVSQRNGGVSSARNHALKICKGQFVTFLDADDELYADSIRQVIQHVQQMEVPFDILYCRSFKKMSDNQLHEVHPWKHLFEEKRMYERVDLHDKRFINGGCVWGGVYRKEFFSQNQLQFAEGVANGEDTIFVYLMYARHPRVVFRDIKLNVINVREGSATHNCTMERVRKVEKNILYLIHQRTLHQGNASMSDAINKAAYHSIMLAVEMYLSVDEKRSYKELPHLLHINEICPLRIAHPPFHQRVKSFLLNHSFWLCLKFVQCENWKNKFVNTFIKR